MKNFRISLSMATIWIWYRYNNRSKIFLAAWMESVTTMILEMSFLVETWLILDLIAKSLASVLVTKTTWWIVLVRGQLNMCICEMDVVISFLILASMITIAVNEERDNSITMLLSCWRQILSFSLLYKLKEKQSEKLLMILRSRESLEWRGEKEGKTLLNLLSVSTKWPLMRYVVATTYLKDKWLHKR